MHSHFTCEDRTIPVHQEKEAKNTTQDRNTNSYSGENTATHKLDEDNLTRQFQLMLGSYILNHPANIH